MATSARSTGRDDGRLWAIALGLSLLLNVAVLGLAGYAAIRTKVSREPVAVAAPVPAERVITIFPEIAADDPVMVEAAGKPRFARTSTDQAAPPPEKADLIGERDTRATSDRAPAPDAPPLPSQAGIEPRHENDFETTESDYRDGELEAQSSRESMAGAEPAAAAPPAPPAPQPADSPPGKPITNPGSDEMTSNPAPADQLLEGPNPVDVAVAKPVEKAAEPKPTPPKRQEDAAQAAMPVEPLEPPKPVEPPKPPAAKPASDPAFAGHQRKASIVGSISRSGRSAMNVANTPLGRYQALISRAVELEWQRNCVRHADFITPGYLTVRFFVEPSGKVRTVQFVGQMQTGEVQKGFTLNSIRDAAIPAMPAALKKEYAKEPLELIFNFYF